MGYRDPEVHRRACSASNAGMKLGERPAPPLRVAVTGRSVGLPLFDSGSGARPRTERWRGSERLPSRYAACTQPALTTFDLAPGPGGKHAYNVRHDRTCLVHGRPRVRSTLASRGPADYRDRSAHRNRRQGSTPSLRSVRRARPRPAEFEVLMRIARTPGLGLRMSDLAAQTLLTTSGITRVVDRLERDAPGRAARSCPTDRRGSLAAIHERRSGSTPMRFYPDTWNWSRSGSRASSAPRISGSVRRPCLGHLATGATRGHGRRRRPIADSARGKR